MDAVRDYLNDVKIDSPTEPDDERVASLGNLTRSMPPVHETQ